MSKTVSCSVGDKCVTWCHTACADLRNDGITDLHFHVPAMDVDRCCLLPFSSCQNTSPSTYLAEASILK